MIISPIAMLEATYCRSSGHALTRAAKASPVALTQAAPILLRVTRKLLFRRHIPEKKISRAKAVHSWTEPVDVVWIGQSLHHLRRPAKLTIMREIMRVIGDNGRF